MDHPHIDNTQAAALEAAVDGDASPTAALRIISVPSLDSSYGAVQLQLNTESGHAPLDTEAGRLLSHLTILTIDDEPMLTDVIQAYLEDAGYRNVVAVNDPLQAMSAARRCMPSLILLDLMMPGVSGFDVLAAFRRDPRLRYLPVIVLTAASDPATKLRALELGASEFLTKPVDESELVLRVRNALFLKVYQDRLANTDVVTGLPTRRVFVDRLRNNLDNQSGSRGQSALMHVHLDRFRRMAQTLGSSATDQLLARVSRRLRGCVQREDDGPPVPGETVELSRCDNDSFWILLPRIEGPGLPAQVAQRVHTALGRPFQMGDDQVYVSSSVGIAVSPGDGNTADRLMANATAAMESAQGVGNSCYRFYCSELNETARDRLQLELHLRRARELGELTLMYQPKFDAQTGEIVGAEALMRWNHPAWGWVSPGRFIPVAEECGVIIELGQWVIEQTCCQVAEWHRRGLGRLKVAVNVSRHELVAGGMVPMVMSTLQRHGVHPQQLVLELTESVLVDRVDIVGQQLAELRALGVQISIDDFGTGYSSMNYLKHFPMDELKIDRSFVQGLPDSVADAAIVRAMCVLGQSLGMRVVAEGVELPQQRALLIDVGVDQLQGYLLGRPMGATEFAALLKPDA